MLTTDITEEDTDFVKTGYFVIYKLSKGEEHLESFSNYERSKFTIFAMDKKRVQNFPSKKYIISNHMIVYNKLKTEENYIYDILYFSKRIPFVMDIDIKINDVTEIFPAGKNFLSRIVGISENEKNFMISMKNFSNVRRLEIYLIKTVISVMNIDMEIESRLLHNIRIKTGSVNNKNNESSKISLHMMFYNIGMYDADSSKDLARDTALCLHNRIIKEIQQGKLIQQTTDLDIVYCLQAHKLGKSGRSIPKKKTSRIILQDISHNDYIHSSPIDILLRRCLRVLFGTKMSRFGNTGTPFSMFVWGGLDPPCNRRNIITQHKL
eukprot:GHVR01004574.1.p1 GENE.GHVR01004574.1~~GHVR01004574.1.p1  ORF type:complete len:329 (-),score=10.37 GHVR01004574.1:728-1693(-)